MSYASSSSSLDAFDPFFPHHHYAGGTPSPSSSISSFSSVFAPFADEDAQLKRNHQQAFVETLIKQKQEQDRVLVAFNVRCQTLEGEVLRLSSLVAQLEREKREASAARSTLHGDVPVRFLLSLSLSRLVFFLPSAADPDLPLSVLHPLPPLLPSLLTSPLLPLSLHYLRLLLLPNLPQPHPLCLDRRKLGAFAAPFEADYRPE